MKIREWSRDFWEKKGLSWKEVFKKKSQELVGEGEETWSEKAVTDKL